MTETISWIRPGEYSILLRYKKNKLMARSGCTFICKDYWNWIPFSVSLEIASGYSESADEAIAKGTGTALEWVTLQRLAQKEKKKKNQPKPKGDRHSRCQLKHFVKPSENWLNKPSENKTIWKKVGNTSICRRNKNVSSQTGLLDAVDGIKLKGF